ncbi:MFS transporter [Aeromicrobium sp. CF4.19]|uniref:MFS transporter n=1 Tax=Aeromicrobium sp. CF4.19 TaxID=3373082 RepID=UPI003EE7ED55
MVDVRRRFLMLLALRWLATGLVIPVSLLLPLARGLGVAEVATAMAAQGAVVIVMEIPSGALTDAWGRRPVFIASGVVAIGAYALSFVADSVLAFTVAWAAMGLFRALDSGPLEAWFVDAERARGAADRVPSGLALAGGVISAMIATGSLSTALLLHLAPGPASTTLAIPYVAAAVVVAVQVVVAWRLMEPAARSVDTPRVTWGGALGAGVRLALGPTLRWLTLAMVFIGVGVAALELLMPVRLEEFSADEAAAGTAMGLVSAAAWGLAALGALVVSRVLRHRAAGPVAVVLVLAEAAGLVAMALAAGPIVLVAGFWAAYLVHTAFGATYNSLVHDRVDDRRRGTALSVTSMLFLGSAAASGVALGALAEQTSASWGLLAGAIALVVAAALVLTAVRRPGDRAQAEGPSFPRRAARTDAGSS